MNILVISPFLPYPLDQGGKIRVFNVIKHLSRNHSVTLACLATETTSDFGPLADFCQDILVVTRKESFARDFARFMLLGQTFNCARFASGSFRRKLLELTGRQDFDLVQIEFSMLWQYAALFRATPVVLDAHNIEYRNLQQIGAAGKGLLKRLLYDLEARRLKAVEERAWRDCAACFAVSDRERDEIALSLGGDPKVVTAANGVDPERFTLRSDRAGGKSILFLGGMDYSPNLDAARYFLGEVFPIVRREEPEARLLLVGRELGRLGDCAGVPGVECHESVPEVLPWFYRADLLAVPLRLGAGTRIKVLEAMAAGLPVVASSKGCEGIAAENGRELLIADTPQEFAAAVLKVLRSQETARALALNARSLVLARYTWESAAQLMEETYKETLRQAGQRA